MPQATGGPIDIILVHGLFIGSWAWARVSEILSAEFIVHTPELPFRSLATDAELVRARVSASVKAGHGVLLVGHSYGGMVISAAGHEATRLAYLSALMPQPGESAADVAGAAVTSSCNEAILLSSDGLSLHLDDQKSIDALYHLCSPADAGFAVSHHRSAPASLFAEQVAKPAWLERPSTYLVCGHDRALTPDYQRACATRLGSRETLVTDHSAFFSQTEELASIIGRLARACRIGGAV